MTPHVLIRPVLLLLPALLALLGLLAPTAAHAQSSSYGRAALAEAPQHEGKPYRYGADGPDSFDCSGFTQYLFARQGKDLPHSSRAQYDQVHKVAKGDLSPGDLVFTYDGDGRIYHVGLYEGDGVMWAATKSGDVVRRQRIWTDRYVVGRVT